MTLANLEKILLFLVILFLPTQLGRHFWPDFSYIYSLKIDYLSPIIYFWDILTTGLLMVWILQKPAINKAALNLLLFFLFTQALSLLGSFNVGAGLVRLEQLTIAGFFGVYLASVIPRGAVATRGNLDAGLLAMTRPGLVYLPLALGILGESFIAILQFIKGGTLGLWIFGERSFTLSTPGIAKFDFYGYEFLRPYATFPHPNALAGFMLLSVVILSVTKDLSRMRELKQVQRFFTTFRMTIWRILVSLAGLTILLTMSRTAILAGFFAMTLSLRTLRRRWIVVITIITIILSPILFTRFSSLLSFDNLTLLRREELADNAWQMFLKSPVFGVGLNNFIPVMADQLVAGPSRFLQPVHNIFLLALSETGFIGFIGLISLIGFPILSSLLRVVARGKLRQGSINNVSNWIPAYAGMTVLIWFTIFFLGMFDHYFLTLPQGYRILFLVWGLSFSMSATRTRPALSD